VKLQDEYDKAQQLSRSVVKSTALPAIVSVHPATQLALTNDTYTHAHVHTLSSSSSSSSSTDRNSKMTTSPMASMKGAMSHHSVHSVLDINNRDDGMLESHSLPKETVTPMVILPHIMKTHNSTTNISILDSQHNKDNGSSQGQASTSASHSATTSKALIHLDINTNHSPTRNTATTTVPPSTNMYSSHNSMSYQHNKSQSPMKPSSSHSSSSNGTSALSRRLSLAKVCMYVCIIIIIAVVLMPIALCMADLCVYKCF